MGPPSTIGEPPPGSQAREEEQVLVRRGDDRSELEGQHWLTQMLLNQDLVESLLLYLAFPLVAAFVVAVREAFG
jgi:hypothetical protein